MRSTNRAAIKVPGHPNVCPLCHSSLIEWLRRMSEHHPTDDWYRCDTCDHLFTVDRKWNSSD